MINLQGSSILITGGAGSFGQALVERLLKKGQLHKIIVYSRDEYKQYLMREKFGGYDSDPMRYFLGDVRDVNRLSKAMEGVTHVIHTAALKQVPSCEYNPSEAIKTNVLGTMNVIKTAADHGVNKVIMLSSDKAVNPINLYGATKLCAEKLVIGANAYYHSASNFSVVRYGNVLGSRGSCLQVFKDQAKKGVMFITDESMTRFWWRVEHAVDFVLMSLDKMKGAEIFIPKLGSCSVKQLVSSIIACINPHAKIKIIGARPGEKLHEWLIAPDEVQRTNVIGWCYIVYTDMEHYTPLKMGVCVANNLAYCSSEECMTASQLEKLMYEESTYEDMVRMLSNGV